MFTRFFLKMLNREASSPKNKALQIMEKLRISPGMVIADIGSGGGYFTLEFAKQTGKNGKVYAVDVKPDYLEFVRTLSGKAGLSNIEFIIAGNDEPKFPASSLDLIFARNVFHHLAEPAKYFRNLKSALKPGGRVAIIDHAPAQGFGFVRLFKHSTSAEAIIQTMKAAEFQLSESFEFLAGQTFMLFSCPDDKISGGHSELSRLT